MSLKKLFTGKPGNVPELLEATSVENVVQVTYHAENDSGQFGTIGISASIVYRMGENIISEKWNSKFGSVESGRERESMLDSLRNQAGKNLGLIRDSGLICQKQVDISSGFY